MLRARQLGARIEGGLAQLRLLRNEANRAADRPCTVQRSLRTAQYLDAVDIDQLQWEKHGHFAEIRRYRRLVDRRIVVVIVRRADIEGAQGVVVAVSRYAWTFIDHAQPGNEPDEAVGVRNARLQQLIGRDGRYVVGHILDALRAPCRGDGDGFQGLVGGK
jgi:hypothetical protein